MKFPDPVTAAGITVHLEAVAVGANDGANVGAERGAEDGEDDCDEDNCFNDDVDGNLIFNGAPYSFVASPTNFSTYKNVKESNENIQIKRYQTNKLTN